MSKEFMAKNQCPMYWDFVLRNVTHEIFLFLKMTQFNPYQALSYNAKYGSPKPKVKHTHWVVTYNGRILTKPMYYSGCQVELKQFKQMGLTYPDKNKFKIVGV